MKVLLSIVALFVLTVVFTVQDSPNKQEVETLEATFVKYEDDIYHFTDEEDYAHEFQQINKSVLETYNLKDDLYKGKSFVITYETDTQEDEEGDELITNTITGLKLKE